MTTFPKDRTAQPLVSPAEAEAGAAVDCPRCRSANPAGRKFCGNCGGTLWEPCFLCNTPSLAGAKFCGTCGAKLAGGFHEHLQKTEADLQAAERLRAEHRFDDALARLAPLLNLQHLRFAEIARRAQELAEACHDQREAWRARVDSAAAEAQERFDQRRFDEAARLLEAIPAPLRDARIDVLLKEARDRQAEIAQLSREIRGPASQKLTGQLLDQVGRLLELKPDHAAAQEIAQRFRQRVLGVAQEKLARREYDDVQEFLGTLPESVRDDAIAKVEERARELSWLIRDLQTSPVVDPGLLALGARLLEMAPQDEEVVQLVRKLQQRAAAAQQNSAQPIAPWVPPSGPPALGYPVEWATALPKFDYDKIPLPQLLENPGRFAVACGLALQGLGKAAVATNLLPPEKSIFAKVSKLVRTRAAQSAWGLDISSSGVKAVKLAFEGDKQDKIAIVACDLVEHRKPLSQAAGEQEERTLIEASLAKLTSQSDVKADRICVGLPGWMVLIRHIQMPPLEPAKIAAMVPFEARALFPLPLEELVWTYAVLDDPKEAAQAKRNCRVAVMAVRGVQLRSHLSKFQDCGLQVDVVQSDCLALHNFLQYGYFGDRSADRRAIAMIDVGCDATNVVVSSPHSIWFRSSNVGVDRINKVLVRQFNLTMAAAEQWKRNPASVPSVSRLYETMEPLFEDIFAEVETSLHNYHKQHGPQSIARILLSGGGAQLHGLLRYLQTRR